MDFEDSDQEAEAAAMAQMMGFTAFGSQAPPSKKRRYNPRADAVADPDGAAGPPAPWGTGANTLPLLPRSVLRGEGQVEAAAARGGGEAGKGGEAGQGGQSASEVGAGGVEGEVSGRGGGDDDPAPQYIDTSRSPIRTGEDQASSSLPATAPGYGEHRAAGHGGGSGRGYAPGKRIWWTDYYDPSSNENPWEFLEKARGLEPVGPWLPRGHGANRAGGGRSG